MSIEEQGFLSPDIEAYIDKHRAENRAWFNFAVERNSLAQQLLLEHPVADEVAHLVTLLFVRGLTSFQSALLLAERGMIQDARTITRSCLESAFCLGALLKNPGYLEKFERQDVYNKKKFESGLLASGSKTEPKIAEKLSQFLKDLERSGEKGEKFNLKDIADSAGLSDVYSVYRGLSNDAAHPLSSH